LKLTDEQAAAVENRQERFVVTAAAGSGKTSVLTERYLHHVVEGGLRPDQILTITFTRKAAAEMKERIVRRLVEVGRENDAQIAETGPIQTIHSFCERVLRENAISAGLDPEFEVLDENFAQQMRQVAVREAVIEAYEEDGLALPLLHNLAGLTIFNGTGQIDEKIRQAVDQCMRGVRGIGRSPSEILELHSTPEAVLTEWYHRAAESLHPDIAELVIQAPLELKEEVLFSEMKARRIAKPSWFRKTSHQDSLDQASQTTGLVWIAVQTWQRLEDEMRRIQKFDFTSLESMAVQLVTENAAVSDRLRNQFKTALIDESQDVNPMQHKLIRSLDLKGEMLVGDPQQSIYRFRQADRELFVQAAEQMPMLKLSRNFRSDPGILAFVDRLFARLWPKGYEPMGTIDDADDPFASADERPFTGVEFWEMEAYDSNQVVKNVQSLIQEGKRPSEIAVLIRTAAFAQTLCDALTAAGVPARIAGGSEQFYTRLEVRDLANALQAICDPRDRFAQLAVMHSPLAGLSLDTIVMTAKAASPIEALRDLELDDEAEMERIRVFLHWFDQLPSDADRIPAWELLGHITARSPYLPRIAAQPGGRQMLANVRKLLRIAAESPDQDGRQMAETIREIQVMRHREGDAPAEDESADMVTLMTVHKAKGLEFDTVVLAQNFRKVSPFVQDVYVDSGTGLCAARFLGKYGPGHSFLQAQEKIAGEAEEMRVLYVAMTRAKNRLCLVMPCAADGRTTGGLIAKALSWPNVVPEGIVVRGRPEGPKVD
jgi:ATP-dependent exoDNAse (exonuclease V) beta subunit